MSDRKFLIAALALAFTLIVIIPASVAALGTTNPIYVPLPEGSPSLEPGDYYYVVSIYNAQAAYMGKSWEKAHQLLVTSEVAMDNPPQAGAKMIQRLKRVIKNNSVLLGLSDNLIDPTPAIASSLRISVSYVVSPTSKLAELEHGINNDAFVAPFSLAPGALPIIQGLARVSDTILRAFSNNPSGPAPILDFSTSFTLPRKDLRDGYYVVFGSYDKGYPLPADLSGGNIAVQPNCVLIDGRPVTDLSYIVLLVSTFPRRGWQTGQGPWCERLQRAYGIIGSVKYQPSLATEERYKRYDDCVANIEAASALFEADPSYLLCEKAEIIEKAYQEAQAILPAVAVTDQKSISLDSVGSKLTGCDNLAQLTEKVAKGDELLSVSEAIRTRTASLISAKNLGQSLALAEAEALDRAVAVAEASDLLDAQKLVEAQAEELAALKRQLAGVLEQDNMPADESAPVEAPQ